MRFFFRILASLQDSWSLTKLGDSLPFGEGLDEAYCEENQGGSQDDFLSTGSRCLKIPRSDLTKMIARPFSVDERSTSSDSWSLGGLASSMGDVV